jgi:hypothetical protein
VIAVLIAAIIAIPFVAMNSESESAPPVVVETYTLNDSKPDTKPTKKEAKSEDPIDNMGRNEIIATAINMAGYLCARVESAYAIGDGNIYVVCKEYRKGRSRVKYTIDPNSGIVEPR